MDNTLSLLMESVELGEHDLKGHCLKKIQLDADLQRHNEGKNLVNDLEV